MLESMKKALASEIDFINSVLAYEDPDELEVFHTIEDASEQAVSMVGDHGADFPETLANPETMLLVWNHCVEEIHRRASEKASAKKERFDHCDWAVYSESLENPNHITISGWFKYPFAAEDFIAKCLPAENRGRFRIAHRDEIEKYRPY